MKAGRIDYDSPIFGGNRAQKDYEVASAPGYYGDSDHREDRKFTRFKHARMEQWKHLIPPAAQAATNF